MKPRTMIDLENELKSIGVVKLNQQEAEEIVAFLTTNAKYKEMTKLGRFESRPMNRYSAHTNPFHPRSLSDEYYTICWCSGIISNLCRITAENREQRLAEREAQRIEVFALLNKLFSGQFSHSDPYAIFFSPSCILGFCKENSLSKTIAITTTIPTTHAVESKESLTRNTNPPDGPQITPSSHSLLAARVESTLSVSSPHVIPR